MHNFSVHINEEIKSPDYYSRIFDLLLDAGDNDVVHFFICSPGGRVDGLNVLLEGIRMTEAHTVAVLLGEAHSAASILALNCREVIVTDSAESLIHSCRFGASGKAADIAAQTAHTLKTTERLARETYSGFLTDEELNQMLAGKEWYFDADQIRERLQRRADFLEQQENPTVVEIPKESEPKKLTKTKQK
jgi:ATP-dependent protease ClpP protease subunit